MAVFATVVTQSDAAIAMAGDQFLRYGYNLGRWIEFNGDFTPMNKFTYWKCSDMWIRSGYIPDVYLDQIRFLLFGGVTIWKNPADIGNTDITDNYRRCEMDDHAKEQRDVETLVDQKIPYSEMTEDEIESVIEYRAGILSNESSYQERMSANDTVMQIAANRFADVANRAEAMLSDSVNDAMERLNSAVKYAKEVRNEQA